MDKRMDVLVRAAGCPPAVEVPAATSAGLIHGVGIEPVAPSEITTPRGRILPHGFLSYVTRGSAHFSQQPGRRVQLEAGTLLWIPAGQWHALDPIAGPWCEYWLLFDAQVAQTRFGPLLPQETAVSRLGIQASLLMPWRELLDLWFGGESTDPARLLFLLHTLLFEVHALRRPVPPRQPGSVVSRMVFRMHAELDEGNVGFDLRGLAATAGMSYDTLRKRFKKETGLSPKQYWLNLKVQRANALLVNPNHTVKDVAALLGFDDPYYFSRLFKRKTRRAPSALRRRLE
jgi:AraC-like DNA-binding protein